MVWSRRQQDPVATIPHCHHTILTPHYTNTTLLYHHTTVPPHYSATILYCHHTTLSSHYTPTSPHCHHTTLPPHHTATTLHCHHTPLPPHYTTLPPQHPTPSHWAGQWPWGVGQTCKKLPVTFLNGQSTDSKIRVKYETTHPKKFGQLSITIYAYLYPTHIRVHCSTVQCSLVWDITL